MANSQSLVLLPPQPAAAPTSDTTTSKPSKPTQGKSFGHKLDTAKKQIAARVSGVKAAPVKATAKPVAKTPEDQTADEKATDPTVDPATSKPTVKIPEQTAKGPTDAEATEENDETHAAGKSAESTPVKVAAPAKTSADKSKKPVKTETKATPVKNAVVQPTVTKAAADQAVKPDESKSDTSDQTDDDEDSDSTDAISSTNNGPYGSGKVVGKGNPGDGNTAAVNAISDATDDQGTAGNASSEENPGASAEAELAASVEAPVLKASAQTDSHTPGTSTDITGLASPTTGNSPATLAAKSSSATTASPQVQFAEDNHPKIITSIAGELMPKGGTLQLQLNPADLGALQVTVHMQDGVVSASFETSNDNATKMLSHSLGQLKSGLEAAGVSVEKLHVEQAPQKDASGESESDSKSPLQDQQRQAQQDQQRKDMVQRMWRRLAGGSDPLDLVA